MALSALVQVGDNERLRPGLIMSYSNVCLECLASFGNMGKNGHGSNGCKSVSPTNHDAFKESSFSSQFTC